MEKLPVFDIAGLSEINDPDVLVSQFAPYLEHHHKLRIPHGHSFYHVVYFTEGAGTHTLDFDQFEVKPFQIYFMIPGQVHHWEFKQPVDGYVLNFSRSFFQSLLLRPDYVDEFPFFRGATRESVIDVETRLRVKVENIFKEMLQVKNYGKPYAHDRLRVLMLQLFLEINEISHPEAAKASSPYNLTLLRNFQRLVEKNFRTLKLPKDYASLLFVTPNHLNALCRQALNLSAGELIRNRIVLEAKRLLVNGKLPVSQIAWQLNFSDNSYFSKFFKKTTGMTPEEFRKQVLNTTL